MTRFDKLKIAFEQTTDYLFADVLFLDRLLERLNTSKIVCMVFGSSHAKNLSIFLKVLGFSEVSKNNALVLQTALLTALNQLTLKNLIPTSALDAFLAPLIQKAKNVCWSCSKKPETLLRCSRCMKAQYCNTTCQKKHWKEHKATCKAPAKK